MTGPFVHDIDPIIATVFGVHLWWYGFAYVAGFLVAYIAVRRQRHRLGMSMRSVYRLNLLLAVGVLVGGRLIEVVFYEWSYYREHLERIPAYWHGGMSTHGLLLGGLTGVWIFARLERRAFLQLTDALAIPAALIMAFGRIGNFVDGQIVGGETAVPWAVKFPDAEGFRHPVVLYDALKNLLIVPVLLLAGRWSLPPGVKTGIFLFLYAFLRLFVDLFREYPTTLFGLATGQVLNLMMSGVGLALIVVPLWRARHRTADVAAPMRAAVPLDTRPASWQAPLYAAILLFSLLIPSDWTQDVPARYGKRHEGGLSHSAMYPPLGKAPPPASSP
jgi:phosphatidylglycerol---prolipoprotein diacylglyceryl transferase